MGIIHRLERSKEHSIALVRMFVGLIFLLHGAQKFGFLGGPGIDGFSGFLTQIGIPLGYIFSPVVGIVELFGGIALLLGFFVRYASIALAINMLVAVFAVHLNKGFLQSGGYEYPLLLFLLCIMFMHSGAGSFSLEKMLFDEEF